MMRLHDHITSGNGYKVRLLLTLLGLPFTRTVPSTLSKSSGCTFSAGATFAKRASQASTAARRVEELTPPTVVEPPEPPEGG